MAFPVTLNGTQVLLLLSAGGSPEVFEAPCGLNAKSFNREVGVNEFTIRDCADPDAPAWTARIANALSATIEGSGLIDRESIQAYEDFQDQSAGGSPQNAQIILNYGSGNKRVYQGPYIMTSLNYTGNDDEFAQVSFTLQSAGPIVALPVGSP